MRLPPLALTLAVLLTLTACVPAPNQSRQEGTVAPTDAPLFASDAEALAAAEEVYREYSVVADQVAEGRDVQDLAKFVTNEWLEQETLTYLSLREEQKRLVGQSTIRSINLQSFADNRVVIYVCHETSNIRVIDASGADVTPADRPPTATLQVTLTVDESRLLISDSELWSTSC